VGLLYGRPHLRVLADLDFRPGNAKAKFISLLGKVRYAYWSRQASQVCKVFGK
jgi:hypothetical protein